MKKHKVSGVWRTGVPQRHRLPWDAYHNRAYEPVETRAAQIYDTFEYVGPGQKPAWTPNGNAEKQDEARSAARRELRAAGHTSALSSNHDLTAKE